MMLAAMWVVNCNPGDARFKQYYSGGEQLYIKKCSNCHQTNGQGLRKVYPPVAGSDFLKNNLERVVCGMKYGMDGEIVVNGVGFQQAMPGDITLTPLELAEIATYIYNAWGEDRGLIDAKVIDHLLDSCRRPLRLP
jgi:mono/diheme cytochrome c family protein